MSENESGRDRLDWAKFVIRNLNEENYEEAFDVFTSESEKGNPEAQYDLALMYARGQGVPKDYETALGWFQKSMDGGYDGAAYFIGKMNLLGLGTPQSTDEAERLFRSVASIDARAMYELGLMYFTGKYRTRDLEECFNWMNDAAEAGHVEAQFVIGQLYKSGAGTTRDMDLAIKWLTKAAVNRHKGAQILLGNIYRIGDGVVADREESDRWYDMADGKSFVFKVQ